MCVCVCVCVSVCVKGKYFGRSDEMRKNKWKLKHGQMGSVQNISFYSY